MERISSADQITQENIRQLSESDIYQVMDKVIRPLSASTRSQYMNVIRSGFDIRSISASKKELKKDMVLYGFKFFNITNNVNLILGIKKKNL
jgi:hypothetical protein